MLDIIEYGFLFGIGFSLASVAIGALAIIVFGFLGLISRN